MPYKDRFGKNNSNYRGRDGWIFVDRICPFCGKTFFISNKNLLNKPNRRKFCSQSCASRCHKQEHPEKFKGQRNMGGYIYLLLPDHPMSNSDNYYAEHRLIMEKKIGRYLTKHEVVHHLNGIKNDNRIENLELLSSVREHAREHFLKNGNGGFSSYWTPEHRKEQSERVIKLRSVKYWSSNKKKV